VARALVLGILSVHGHKDRDAFVWALSSLGLHSTQLQYHCFQQYYCLCAGITDSFCTHGLRRRSPSNERWVSHQQYAEEMNEEGTYNGSFIGARYSPEERERILEIPYFAIPLLYNGPFQKESPFGYFTTIPQPPSADNIYSFHPLPTLRAPASEAEINLDIARREHMRILNTNVGGAYSTPELLWFMDKTNERSALRASQKLIYSLQENGTTPDKQIMQILRSRRALTEGVLLIPEHVVLIPDIPTAPTGWDGSAASLFAPSDPPRANMAPTSTTATAHTYNEPSHPRLQHNFERNCTQWDFRASETTAPPSAARTQNHSSQNDRSRA